MQEKEKLFIFRLKVAARNTPTAKWPLFLLALVVFKRLSLVFLDARGLSLFLNIDAIVDAE